MELRNITSAMQPSPLTYPVFWKHNTCPTDSLLLYVFVFTIQSLWISLPTTPIIIAMKKLHLSKFLQTNQIHLLGNILYSVLFLRHISAQIKIYSKTHNTLSCHIHQAIDGGTFIPHSVAQHKTLKIKCNLSHETGQQQGSAVKVEMCYVPLAETQQTRYWISSPRLG